MLSPKSALVSLALAVVFASVFASSSAAAADYGATGPRPVVVTQIEGQGELEGSLAFPDAPDASTPVIVLAHGFASSPQRMVGWGEHFASHGFVTISPRNCVGDLLCGPDPAAQVSLIENGLAYLASEAAPTAVRGKIDPTRLLFLGHSAGGQAMVVAANTLRPTALVLFDPVGGEQSPESVEPAKTALSTTCATTLTLFAEGHVPDAAAGTPSCNKSGSWRAFGLSSTGPRASAIVKGSTHCDGELPPRAACGFSCGGKADEIRQATYKRHATAFALAVLRDDPQATLALGESFAADPALRDVRVEDGVSCTGKGWPGGVSAAGGAGGAVGAAGGTAAGAGGDASSGSPTAPASDEGCGCHTATDAPPGSLAVLVGAVALVVARRRQGQRVG